MAKEVLRLELSFDSDGTACVGNITGCVDRGYFLLSAREASQLMAVLSAVAPSVATNRRRIAKWRAERPPSPWESPGKGAS